MDETIPYEFIKPIGGGGFGDVWLARQKKTKELVALKIMRVPDDVRNNQEARQRFLREIEIASLLDHPHILPALDHGYVRYQGQESPYLVSPYMPDGSLGGLLSSPKKFSTSGDPIFDALSSERLPPWEQWSVEQTVDTITQAAEALEYIHTLKPRIVHQDVKPGNFLFRRVHDPAQPERVVHLYLCDFGISRWQKTEADVTTNLLGSRHYMPPERLFEGKIAWTTDLYALAVMAYLFLVGDYPVRVSSGKWYLRPPSQVRPERVPYREIDVVLLKALDFDPALRYPSVAAFARALQLATRGEVDGEEERTALQDMPLAETAQPFVPVADERIPVIGPRPAVAPQKSPVPPKPTPGSLPFRLPFEQQPELPPLQVFSKQVLYKSLPAVPNMVRWSPDGQSLVCTFYGHHEALVIGKDGQEDSLKDVGAAVLACWGPGGRILALGTKSGAKGAICFWQRDISSQRLPVVYPEGEIGDIDWSRRGQLAVWAGQHILLYALPQQLSAQFQSPTPQTLTGPELICGGAGVLRWSPDGSLLAAGTLHGTVICWNMGLETPTISCQFSVPGRQIHSLAWSPDGAYLAATFSNKSVVIWDMQKNERRQAWNDLPFVPRMVSLSPSHRVALASRATDLLFGALDDSAPTGRYPGQWFVAWSPAAAEFASLDAHRETSLVIWGE